MEKINIDGYPEFVTYALEEMDVRALISVMEAAEATPGNEEHLCKLEAVRNELRDGVISLNALYSAVSICKNSRPKWYRNFRTW